MRRALYGMVSVLILCSLAGCAAFPFAHEIESTVLMRALGVDVGTESIDGVAVTASSGARPAAGTQKPEPPTVLAAQADTVSAACQRIQALGDQFVFYGDVDQLLLGEGQAQRSLTTVLAHVGRDRDLRLEAQLWVVKGASAADVLFSAEEGGGASSRLDAMREDAGLFSAALPKTARETLVELTRNGCTFVPALAAVPSRAGDGATGGTAIAPAGYALFRDGALVGWTDSETSRGVNLLLGQVDTDIFEVMTPDCSRVALKINGASVKYQLVVENGLLTGLAVQGKIEADVAERRGDCVLDQETLAWLEHALATVAQGRMAAAAALLQALDADCLGLGAKATLAAPWYKEVVGDQWGAAFASLPVTVFVEAKVARE